MAQFVLGRHRVSAQIIPDGEHLLLKFGFNDAVKNEVKDMLAQARWNPENKCWRVLNNHRTKFGLAYLQGQNPYARYDSPLPKMQLTRPEGYEHQGRGLSHILTRKQTILGAEMGSGKTLVSIEFLEYLQRELGNFNAWFVGPKTANLSVRIDYKKWNAKYWPNFYTLHELKKVVSNWPAGNIPPRVLIVDESSKVRNADAKISQAVYHLAEAIRDHWGDDGYIVLMSGSPAPKSPIDWWMQCEIARPGFLRESTPRKLLDRVAIVKKIVGESGITWPRIVTFKDNPEKCLTCGRLKDHEVHKCDIRTQMTYVAGSEVENQLHPFEVTENEVAKLSSRLDGLVLTIFKKDCLDLPEKVFRVVECEPTKQQLALAKMFRKTGGAAFQVMALCAQLSDGFVYQEEFSHEEICSRCEGTGLQKWFGEQGPPEDPTCIHCGGKKKFKRYKDTTVECDTPKTEALIAELELCEDRGRVNVFAAFTASIDRVCKTVEKQGWKWIRRDGRGWLSNLGTNDPEDLLMMYQRQKPCEWDQISFVAHPKSAGMGLTLTEADTSIYYSNSFDGEDRIQSVDRIHRPGQTRGCNIVDLACLPIDYYVREKVIQKLNMQAITMGDLDRVMGGLW
jgi:hypothetical protein